MFFTSDTLIQSVKDRTLAPSSQTTFSNQTILNFANEEMQIKMVPYIMSMREDYFLKFNSTAIRNLVTRFNMPQRAIANGLKDLFYVDNNSNRNIIPRINIHDLPINSAVSDIYPSHFYVFGDQIVISPAPTSGSVGNVELWFYQKPSTIILTANCAKIVSVAQSTPNTVFTLDTDISTTLGNLGTSQGASLTLSSATVTLSAANAYIVPGMQVYDTTTGGNITAGTTVQSVSGTTLTLSAVAAGTAGSDTLLFVTPKIDFLSGKSPFQLWSIDIPVVSATTTTITVATSGVYDEGGSIILPVVNDYIVPQLKCNIPMLPEEFHPLLAELSAARVVQAMGDMQKLQMIQANIAEMKTNIQLLMASRTEQATEKIVNRYSLDRVSGMGYRTGFFR